MFLKWGALLKRNIKNFFYNSATYNIYMSGFISNESDIFFKTGFQTNFEVLNSQIKNKLKNLS